MSISNTGELESQLRQMTPTQRQQYAMQAQQRGDMQGLALAKFINDQQQQEAAKAKQAQMSGQPQPPTVAQQAVQSMTPPLPEQQGIGQLPTPNVAHMADGGIAGYPEPSQFDFVQNSEPVVRMAGGGDTARAPFRYASSPEEKDQLSILQAELAKAQRQLETARDATEAARAQTDIYNITRELARVPGSGVAMPAARPVQATPADLTSAAAPAAARNASQGERALTGNEMVMGIPQAVSHYMSNLYAIPSAGLMALGQGVSSAVGGGDAGKDAEEEFVKRLRQAQYQPQGSGRDIVDQTNQLLADLKIPPIIPGMAQPGRSAPLPATRAAANKASARRLEPPGMNNIAVDSAGIATLPKGRSSAVEALARYRAAKAGAAADAAADAAVRDARLQGTMAQDAAMQNRASLVGGVGAARAATNNGLPAEYGSDPGQSSPQAPAPGYGDFESRRNTERAQDLRNEEAASMPDLTKGQQKGLVDLAKRSPEGQAAKDSGFTKDDWIMLGLGLLANKSQYFSQALGEAGMGAMQSKLARQKAEREDRGELAKEAANYALADKYRADAAATGAGQKYDIQTLQTAVNAIRDQLKDPLVATNEQMAGPLRAQLAAYTKALNDRIGITMPSSPAGDFSGMKIVGVRPGS